MKPEAIIFDMDGLMIDSERVTRNNYHKVFDEHGIYFQDSFYETLLGKNKQGIFAMFKEKYGPDFPIEELYPKVHEYIIDDYNARGVPVKKGLVNLLKTCRKEGIKTCIATSSNRHRVEDILERTGLGEYFDDMVCGDEVARGKPNPDIFLTAAAKVKTKPEHALVLEDSESGIQAADAAGIPVICVLDLKMPSDDLAQKTAAIVDDLDAVNDLIAKD